MRWRRGNDRLGRCGDLPSSWFAVPGCRVLLRDGSPSFMRRLCLEAGCPNDSTWRGRCRAHARQRNRETSPNQALYARRKWKTTRRRYLNEHDHQCERCGGWATDVHHVQALQDGGDPWSADNLEALCKACHSRAGRVEQMA